MGAWADASQLENNVKIGPLVGLDNIRVFESFFWKFQTQQEKILKARDEQQFAEAEWSGDFELPLWRSDTNCRYYIPEIVVAAENEVPKTLAEFVKWDGYREVNLQREGLERAFQEARHYLTVAASTKDIIEISL